MSPFVVLVQVDGIQSLAFFHLLSGHCRTKVLCMTFVILTHLNNGSHVRLIRIITFTVYLKEKGMLLLFSREF